MEAKAMKRKNCLWLEEPGKHNILWINSWLYSPRNLGSFQLNCHLVSLIFFHDDRKTRPPWLHVSTEFCFDLWFFFYCRKSYFSFPSFLQSLRNASNFSAQNWWYWRVWWDFNLLSPFSNFRELILPTCQGS